MIQTLYPEWNWLPWKFNRVADHFWECLKNQRKYLEYLSQNRIASLRDLYEMSWEQLIHYWTSSVLKQHYNSPAEMVESAFPEMQFLISQDFNEISDKKGILLICAVI